MKQQADIRQLEKLVARIETDLIQLKRALKKYPRTSGKRRVAQKHKSKSLHGIFPASDVTWDDFRDARQSWSRHLEKLEKP